MPVASESVLVLPIFKVGLLSKSSLARAWQQLIDIHMLVVGTACNKVAAVGEPVISLHCICYWLKSGL